MTGHQVLAEIPYGIGELFKEHAEKQNKNFDYDLEWSHHTLIDSIAWSATGLDIWPSVYYKQYNNKDVQDWVRNTNGGYTSNNLLLIL